MRSFSLGMCVVFALATTLGAGAVSTAEAWYVPARPHGGELKAERSLYPVRVEAAPSARPTLAAAAAATATPIPSSPVTGALDCAARSADVYTLEVAEDDRVAFALTGDASLNADVYLFAPGTTTFDPSLAVAGTVGDEFPKRFVWDCPGNGGVYHVVVAACSGTGGYELRWLRGPRPCGPDDDVPGTGLSCCASWQSAGGSLEWPQDTDDVYRFDLPVGKRLEVVLDGPAGADYDLRLYGPGTTTIVGNLTPYGSAGPAADESLTHDVLAGEGGAYYLVVHAAHGAGGYALSWRLSDIPTGAWEDSSSATPISSDSGEVLGSLDRSSDINDLFSIELAAGKRLSVSLTGEAGTDFDLYVHSPDMARVLASAEDWVYPERVSYDTVARGRYFLEVRAFRGSGAYRLQWMVTDAPSFTAAARDEGVDRYETAIQISRSTFAASSVATVVVASGEVFPDALVASGLAGCYGAPVLLTRPGRLPEGVLHEVGRLGATGVVVVGGTGAVSEAVLDNLRKAGLSVERVAGVNRYETARAVALKIRQMCGPASSHTAFLVRGDDFADALAVGPCAYALRAPVLLTTTGTLHPAARGAVTQCEIADLYVAGGTAAVSDGAVSEVQKLVLRPVVRLAGQDRYATAASVATHAVRCYWLDTAQVLVATGARFPDALGGGAAAGKRGCVMVLTRSTVLPVATRDYLARNKASIVAVRILGGVDAVSQDVKSAIESVLK